MKNKIMPPLLIAGIVLNLILMFFNFFIQDTGGIILSVFCMTCFIFSYWVHLNARDEEEKDKKQDDKRSLFR